jgi:O-methyltransferase
MHPIVVDRMRRGGVHPLGEVHGFGSVEMRAVAAGLVSEARRSLKGQLRDLLGEHRIAMLRRWRDQARLHAERRSLILAPTDPRHVEVLHDPRFRASVREVRHLTTSDTAQLANLWQLCQASDPGGVIVEVGVYKGGTALHLSNARPEAELFLCDTFQGFRGLPLDPTLDDREFEWRQTHGAGPFEDASAEAVAGLFAARGRRATVLRGRFPGSDERGAIGNVSFAHVDVTIYDSCRNTLEYLAARSRAGAIWVIDSYQRTTRGVTRAADEFAAAHRDWMLIPLYPGQAALVRQRS